MRVAILGATVFVLACGGDGVPESAGTANASPPPPAGPGNHPPAGGTRLILVYDPTAYLHADTSLVTQQVFEPLKRFVGGLPRNTIVDFYVVAQDGLNRPPDTQDTLPFVGRESNERPHKLRANAVAERLSGLGMERWAAARQRVRQPASCILSTLRRTRASREQAAAANERVAIVVVSDLLEVCDDFGTFNFEVEIPDSFGPLPARVDFSEVDAVHVVQLEHPSVSDVRAVTRLESAWMGLVRSWGVPTADVSLRSTYPGRLFRPAGPPSLDH
jgi:hypothetical protein